MKLYIDTTDAQKITVGFDEEMFTTSAKEQKSQKLLPFINELLEVHNMTLKDISEINVNTGPGSYTGIRVGLSVGMTLAWVMDIPINGKNVRNGQIPEIKYNE